MESVNIKNFTEKELLNVLNEDVFGIVFFNKGDRTIHEVTSDIVIEEHLTDFILQFDTDQGEYSIKISRFDEIYLLYKVKKWTWNEDCDNLIFQRSSDGKYDTKEAAVQAWFNRNLT